MSALRRTFTPGRALALAVSLVAVYFGWGVFFSRDGTGSNVVLGLLLALAALYLVTVNLGAYLDAMFFASGEGGHARLQDALDRLTGEVEATLARDSKRARPRMDADQREALAQGLARVRAARSAYEAAGASAAAGKSGKSGKSGDPGDSPEMQALSSAVDGLETAFAKTQGTASGGVFGQVRSLGIAFAIALSLRAFVVEPFQIPSSSMIPTLQIGDHLFVARFFYGLQSPFGDTPSYLVRWSVPQPGDVVVFVAPPYVGGNAGEDWIKRVIAGPGQRVRLEDSVLYVDDQPYAHVGTPVPETYRDYEEFSRRWAADAADRIEERIGDRTHAAYLSEGTMRTWPGIVRSLPGLSCDQRECRVHEGHIFVMGDNRDRSSDGRRWGAVPIDNVKGKALFIWMSVDGSERSVDWGRFTLPRFRWERLFQGIR